MVANSPAATYGGYFEIETFGSAWYLNYEGHTIANKAGTIQNTVQAWTVNPPGTTPGTAYTKYDYMQNNFGAYTSSHLAVSGYGAVDISSLFNAQSGFQQDAYLGINN